MPDEAKKFDQVDKCGPYSILLHPLMQNSAQHIFIH